MNFLELLTLMFIGMKLLGVINWSWWWVLFPVLFPLYIMAFILVGMLAVGAIIAILALIIGLFT